MGVPGFVTTVNAYVAGGSVAPAWLVPLEGDPAAGGCPICTAQTKWVTAHTPQEQLRQQELREQQQQELEQLLQERRELREQQQREWQQRVQERQQLKEQQQQQQQQHKQQQYQERQQLKEQQREQRQQQWQERQQLKEQQHQERQQQHQEWQQQQQELHQQQREQKERLEPERQVYVPVVPGSKWILRNIAPWRGHDYNDAEVTVVSILPARRALVALKSGDTMSVSLKCLHEMPPALDPDEPGPESEPPASGDPGMERYMAVDSDSQLAKLEQTKGELEQEMDSQMTDAPSTRSPEPAHSPITGSPAERSSLGPHSSVDPADYSSD